MERGKARRQHARLPTSQPPTEREASRAAAQDFLDKGFAELKKNPQRALSFFQRARARGLSFLSADDTLWIERVAACNIANAYYRLGNLPACVDEHTRSLQLSLQAGDTELANKERRNLDTTLVEACKDACAEGQRLMDKGETLAALAQHKSCLSYSERLSDAKDEDRQQVLRVALCNIGNAMQRLGHYERAVRAHSRSLKLSLAARDASLAQTARNNLHLSLLSEASRLYNERAADVAPLTETAEHRYGGDDDGRAEAVEKSATAAREAEEDVMHGRGSEGDAESTTADGAAEEDPMQDPVIKAVKERFFGSLETQVETLLRTNVFEDRGVATAWCLRLRQHMVAAGAIAADAADSQLSEIRKTESR